MFDRFRKSGISPSTATAIAVLIGLLLCLWLDPFIVAMGRTDTTSNPGDLYYLFRVMGFVPTWLFVSAILMLTLPTSARWSRLNLLRAFAPFFSAALAGAAAAVLKLVFRRVRPGHAEHAWYTLRPIAERTFDAGGLSMPSEHSAVAFGAACMLIRMFPKGWPIFLLLAAGCGASRLLYADHYLSDIFVAAMVGHVTAWALVKRFGRREQTLPQAVEPATNTSGLETR